jgi:anaerobic selenocysteine-containing dehydrogenase
MAPNYQKTADFHRYFDSWLYFVYYSIPGGAGVGMNSRWICNKMAVATLIYNQDRLANPLMRTKQRRLHQNGRFAQKN